MSVELLMLTYSAVLAFIMVMIPSTLKLLQYGAASAMGNRDDPRALSGWGARAERAQANMYESLPVFAILVLVVQATSHHSPATAMGAQLFFYARLVYALVYMAGIPWLRTLVWLAGLAGMIMVGAALF
jgi:uncharacterized MAPEG superfamily protein